MKFLKILLGFSVLLLASCATLDALDVSPSTVRDMSDNRLCELLDSDLVTSSRERGDIEYELDYRDLTCREGIAVSTDTPEASIPTHDGPRTIVLEGEEFAENEKLRFESWKCTDFLKKRGAVLVEVGVFDFTEGFPIPKPEGIPENVNVGFVLFDGGDTGVMTVYMREGLEKRWVWGSDLSYQFHLETDGDGAYYDFTGVPEGEKIKADELFSCRKSP